MFRKFFRNVNPAIFRIGLYKNYSNLREAFILRLFKMLTNQTECCKFEQKSVIKSLVVEKFKESEIYQITYDVYREECF